MKVKLWDKGLIKSYYGFLSAISVITSLVFLFGNIPEEKKLLFFLGFLLVLIVVYIGIWIHANNLKKVTLSVNNSIIEIEAGDLFDCEGFKMIAFNEYYDTLVDNEIVSERTLNGKYIKRFYPDASGLDEKILTNSHARDCILSSIQRARGKCDKYKLGTIIKDGQYFLLAFTKFDAENRAYLEINEYADCLLNMWNECDIHYAGNSVVLPLLGSGITRFRGYENISDQELLEMIIWTFKVSRIRFQYPAKAKIVLTKNSLDKINLYEIKQRFKK